MAEIGCNWARIGPSKSSQSLSNAHKWAVVIDCRAVCTFLRLSSCELWLPSPLVKFHKRAWSIIAWMDSRVMLFGLVLLTGVFGPLLVVAVAMSGVPRDGSRAHTHDHDGSEALDESPDSILSSEPKPLGKHRVFTNERFPESKIQHLNDNGFSIFVSSSLRAISYLR
ncbi:hypothetical protein Tco_0089906 [Tanacetum coccineum]